MVKRKNKKIYSEVEKNKTFAKRVRMRLSPREDLGKACYMWLLNARHQSILLSGTIFNVKALCFAKELGCDSFQASNEWLDRWTRKDTKFRLKQYQVYFNLIIYCLCNHFVHEIIISRELSFPFHGLN